MAVETNGRMLMKGDEPPGVAVRVLASDDQLTLIAGDEPVGMFNISDLRINSLPEGFAIRAGGEDFVLTADDDVGLAEEFGIAAASLRLARRIAKTHNTAERPPPPPPPPETSNFGAVAMAVGGGLVIAGGSFFQTSRTESIEIDDPWLVFLIAGAIMVGVAWLLTRPARWPIYLAYLVLAGVAVAFALGIPGAGADVNRITAYGFVAGGLVVGVAGAVSARPGS